MGQTRGRQVEESAIRDGSPTPLFFSLGDLQGLQDRIDQSIFDRALGGVIKFLPAFLIGLGISVVAGIIYVAAWEVSLAMTHYTFMNDYAASAIEAQRAKGVSGPELDAFIAQMEQMKVQYANPLFRLPMTFVEIFPVGVVISLITALVLRNSRFMPARPAPAA